MASHLEVRAAYQDWCLANPLQPMDQFPDYARLAEVADVEPVDMVFKTDLRCRAAARHVAARLRSIEPNDKILLEILQNKCLVEIAELEKTPNDLQAVRWLIPFSLYVAETYERQFLYAGMYKHATAARNAFEKLKESGIETGAGTPYNVWRRCTMQNCVRAMEKMLEVGMYEQWILEMEEGEEDADSLQGSDGDDDGEDWTTETETELDDTETSSIPGLTFSTSTLASSTVPSTPPSKKARSTLRRMGEEEEQEEDEKV